MVKGNARLVEFLGLGISYGRAVQAGMFQMRSMQKSKAMMCYTKGLVESSSG